MQQQAPQVSILLGADEVNHLVGVLGEMPTKANVWLISQKILQQAQTQMNAIALQQAKEAELLEQAAGAVAEAPTELADKAASKK